jgi:hypothetical protein
MRVPAIREGATEEAHGASRGSSKQKEFQPRRCERKIPPKRDTLEKRTLNAFMANTKSLGKEERKKAKRAARKKRKAEKPLGKRTVPRGSAKRKVKKMVRGQAKR